VGAGLVKAAFAVASEHSLDHAPARLLLFMAVTALDDDPAPAFYAGRDSLATALGKSGSAGHRAVTRALEPLTTAGLISSRPAAPGHPARHLLLDGHGRPLRPDAGRSASSVEVTEDAHRPSNEGRSPDQRRTVTVPTRDAHRPAEEERINEEESAPPSRFCPQHPNGPPHRRRLETSSPPHETAHTQLRPRLGLLRRLRSPRGRRMMPGLCVRDLPHEFDVVSGWCLHGCGWREDGRSALHAQRPRRTATDVVDITTPRRSPAGDA